MSRTIEFAIEHGDITSFDADVVGLKYAQHFYGSDKAVVSALRQVGVATESLKPEVGDYRYVETNGGVRARHALFVGVPPLLRFGYREIREFAAATLRILSDEAPDTRHLAMTIHGPGYGLDEVEAVLAQFAGFLQAIQAGGLPLDLERISIVERNDGRVRRLRLALEKNLDDVDYASRVQSPWTYRLAVPQRLGHAGWSLPKGTTAIEMAGTESEGKSHVFVAMPFRKDMDDVFYYGIQTPAHATGFLCERIDQEAFTGDILDRVKERIETAAVVIAELSGANPNVYLEVGYAWGRGRPTILLVRDENELRFDVQSQRCLKYERIKDLEDLLTRELNELKSKGLL
jgi:hypothetical protein